MFKNGKKIIRSFRDAIFNNIETFIITRLNSKPNIKNGQSSIVLFLPRAGRGLEKGEVDDILIPTFPKDRLHLLRIERFNKPFWLFASLRLIFESCFRRKSHIILVQYVMDFHKFPSLNLLRACQRLGCKISKIWMDSYDSSFWKTRILPITDLGNFNLIIDSPDFIPLYSSEANTYEYAPFPITRFPFVPFSERDNFLYYSGGISSSGIYSDRFEVLKFLANHNVPVTGFSYHRESPEKRPSYEKYRSELARSLIGLNFTWKGSKNVMVVRTWEIMSSGVLLLQNESKVFNGLFEPGVHYLEFKSKEHLAEMIGEISSDFDYIKKISIAGKERFEELYSNKKFWEKFV